MIPAAVALRRASLPLNATPMKIIGLRNVPRTRRGRPLSRKRRQESVSAHQTTMIKKSSSQTAWSAPPTGPLSTTLSWMSANHTMSVPEAQQLRPMGASTTIVTKTHCGVFASCFSAISPCSRRPRGVKYNSTCGILPLIQVPGMSHPSPPAPSPMQVFLVSALLDGQCPSRSALLVSEHGPGCLPVVRYWPPVVKATALLFFSVRSHPSLISHSFNFRDRRLRY